MNRRDHVEKRQPSAYNLLLALSIVWTILAIITLIPNPGASKPNALGYKSVCTFAPAASALCGLLAAITCTVRNRVASRNARQARFKSLLLPIGVSILLAGIALASIIVYAGAQSRFGSIISRTDVRGMALGGTADGSWIGTVTEGEVSATVEVTVNGGKITDLRLIGARNVDTPVAQDIFNLVKAAQATDVEAVSGATASSKVLLKAIEEALQSHKL
jgi:uncharacterized protein with FMN-binding domain